MLARSRPTAPASRPGLRDRWRRNPTLWAGGCLSVLVVALALIGPFFAPYNPAALIAAPLLPPSGAHIMGTDNLGRDLFSRWLYGGRTSLTICISATALAAVIGSAIGIVAGVRSGFLDGLSMRITDALMSIPLVVLVAAVAGIFGQDGTHIGPVPISGTLVLIGILAIASLPPFIRLARASTLGEMEEDYIRAAEAMGIGMFRMIWHDLLPNMVSPLAIQASFALSLAISVEATVSFLGFGVQPPNASWGNLLTDAQNYIFQGKWWLIVFPCAIIVIAVIAFNLCGDGLRDALDPKQRTRSLP